MSEQSGQDGVGNFQAMNTIINDLREQLTRVQAELAEQIQLTIRTKDAGTAALAEAQKTIDAWVQHGHFTAERITKLEAERDAARAELAACSISHQKVNSELSLLRDMFCQKHMDELPTRNEVPCVLCALQAANQRADDAVAALEAEHERQAGADL